MPQELQRRLEELQFAALHHHLVLLEHFKHLSHIQVELLERLSAHYPIVYKAPHIRQVFEDAVHVPLKN